MGIVLFIHIAQIQNDIKGVHPSWHLTRTHGFVYLLSPTCPQLVTTLFEYPSIVLFCKNKHMGFYLFLFHCFHLHVNR